MTIAAARLIFLVIETEGQHRRAMIPKGLQAAVVMSAGLVLFLYALDLGAQPHSPNRQSGAQREDVAVQTATPSDEVTVPDGTPLTLELEESLTSATAKVGDAVFFETLYSLRIGGLVVVPKGTAVSGTVVQATQPGRALRTGQVKVTVEKLILPSGEVATLRPHQSGSKRPPPVSADVGPNGKEMGLSGLLWRALLDPIEAAVVLPMALTVKGEAQVYSPGTRINVYLNGPLNLNRSALLKMQPPPHEGLAQVFIKNQSGVGDKEIKLFCGRKVIGDLMSNSFRLLLKPGTYSFSTNQPKERTVRLEVQDEHEYWIDRKSGGLFVENFEERRTKIKEIENSTWKGIDLYFQSVSIEDSCQQAGHP